MCLYWYFTQRTFQFVSSHNEQLALKFESVQDCLIFHIEVCVCVFLMISSDQASLKTSSGLSSVTFFSLPYYDTTQWILLSRVNVRLTVGPFSALVAGHFARKSNLRISSVLIPRSLSTVFSLSSLRFSFPSLLALKHSLSSLTVTIVAANYFFLDIRLSLTYLYTFSNDF